MSDNIKFARSLSIKETSSHFTFCSLWQRSTAKIKQRAYLQYFISSLSAVHLLGHPVLVEFFFNGWSLLNNCESAKSKYHKRTFLVVSCEKNM